MRDGGIDLNVHVDRVLVWVLAGAATALLVGGMVVGSWPGDGPFGDGRPSLAERALLMTQSIHTATWLLLAAAVVSRLTAPLTPTLRKWLIGIGGVVAVLALGGAVVFARELLPGDGNRFTFMSRYPWLSIIHYLALGTVAAATAWWVAQMPATEPLPPDDTEPEVVDLDDR